MIGLDDRRTLLLVVALALLAVLLLTLAGCADIRVPIHATDSHVKAIRRVARAPEGRNEAERLELVSFHAARGLAWTGAMLEHKGAPSHPVDIPHTPDDARAVREEDLALQHYQAEVEAEKALRSAATGWLGKLGLGGGGLGGLGIVGYLLKLLKDKKRAITEYDEMVEKGLSKTRRRALGKGKDHIAREHAAIRDS